MFYWSNNCVEAVLPEITILDLVVWLAIAQGLSRWVSVDQASLSTLPEDQMSMIFCHGPNVAVDVLEIVCKN